MPKIVQNINNNFEHRYIRNNQKIIFGEDGVVIIDDTNNFDYKNIANVDMQIIECDTSNMTNDDNKTKTCSNKIFIEAPTQNNKGQMIYVVDSYGGCGPHTENGNNNNTIEILYNDAFNDEHPVSIIKYANGTSTIFSNGTKWVRYEELWYVRTQNLEDKVDTLDTSAGSLKLRAATLEGRANTLEIDVGTSDTSTGSLKLRAATLEGRANTLESEVGASDTSTGSLKLRAATLEGRANTLESDVSTLKDTTVLAIEGRVTDLEGDLGVSDTSAGSLKLRAVTLEGRADTLESDVGTLKNTTVPYIAGDVNTLKNTTVPDIAEEVNTLKNDVTTLDGRANTLESDVSTLKDTTVPAIEGRVTDLESDVGTLKNTTVPYIAGYVNTLKNTTVPDIAEEVNTLKNDVTTLDGRVNTLENSSTFSITTKTTSGNLYKIGNRPAHIENIYLINLRSGLPMFVYFPSAASNPQTMITLVEKDGFVENNRTSNSSNTIQVSPENGDMLIAHDVDYSGTSLLFIHNYQSIRFISDGVNKWYSV